MIILYWFLVQRRIGGLENFRPHLYCIVRVQRRIGGLETQATRNPHIDLGSTPYRWFRNQPNQCYSNQYQFNAV